MFFVLRDANISLTSANQILTIRVSNVTYATIQLGLTPITSSQMALIFPSTENGLLDYSGETPSSPAISPVSTAIEGIIGSAVGVGTLKIDTIGYMIP